MLVRNLFLYELDGETPLRVQSRHNADSWEEMTFAQVIIQAAMSIAPGVQLATEKSVARYELSKAAFSTAVGADFDVPEDLIPDLLKDLCRSFGPVIVGQVAPVLQGKVVQPREVPVEAPPAYEYKTLPIEDDIGEDDLGAARAG